MGSDSSKASLERKQSSPLSSRHSGSGTSPGSRRDSRPQAPPSPASSQGSSTAHGDQARTGPGSPVRRDVTRQGSGKQYPSPPSTAPPGPPNTGTAPSSQITEMYTKGANPFRNSGSPQRPDYPPPRTPTTPTTPSHSNPFATANNPFMEPGNPFKASAGSTLPSSTTLPPSSRISDPSRPPSGQAPFLQRPGDAPPPLPHGGVTIQGSYPPPPHNTAGYDRRTSPDARQSSNMAGRYQNKKIFLAASGAWLLWSLLRHSGAWSSVRCV